MPTFGQDKLFYFLAGAIICERKKGEKTFTCKFDPYYMPEDILKKYPEKYRDSQKMKIHLPLKNVKSVHFAVATEVDAYTDLAGKEIIKAKYMRPEKMRVCKVYEGDEKILDCGLSVEEKSRELV